MDQALINLLDKKDLEYITIKEICQTAGVNRSTFYLHYDNINELLQEAFEMIYKDFSQSFKDNDIYKQIKTSNAKDLIFIKPEYILPYLNFVKRNLRILKTIRKKPKFFNTDVFYSKMYNDIFFPIVSKFNIPKDSKPYILNFYTKGLYGIIDQWIATDCKDSVECITSIIIDCVGIKNN